MSDGVKGWRWKCGRSLRKWLLSRISWMLRNGIVSDCAKAHDDANRCYLCGIKLAHDVGREYLEVVGMAATLGLEERNR